MTHENLRFVFLFPREGEGFTLRVSHGTAVMAISTKADDCRADVEEIAEHLDRLISMAMQERDIRRAIEELDKDLDDLLGDQGERPEDSDA